MSRNGPDAIGGMTLCPGHAQAPVLTLDEPLSLWGGTDPHSGHIMDTHHPQHGASIAGRVLVMEASRGSSSSSSVLAEQIRAGVGPAAIIMGHRDAILALGALVAAELYRVNVPVVVLNRDDLRLLSTGLEVTVEANEHEARVVMSSGR